MASIRPSFYIKIVACVLAVAAPLASRAADITYTLTLPAVSGATFTGTITTDGTIGTLATSDIVNWNILLTDGSNQLDLTPSDTINELIFGTSLVSATSSALSFNFGGPADSGFIIEGEGGSSGFNLFCIQTTNCSGTGTDDYQMFINGTGVFSPELSGTVVFAQVSAVPVPAAAWLLLSGLGSLGFVARRRLTT